MKKVISICLILVMVLAAFAGCSKNPEKEKEKLLSEATEVNLDDIDSEVEDNLAKAKAEYCNKALKVKGLVSEIKEDCVILGSSNGMIAYLPKEDLVNLEKDQYIEVVGKVNEEITEKSEDILGGGTFKNTYFNMPEAYFVRDTFEYTCTIENQAKHRQYKPEDNKSEYYFLVPTDDSLFGLVYFADGVDTSNLKDSQEIKFKAKHFRFYTQYDAKWHDKYVDAKIIK